MALRVRPVLICGALLTIPCALRAQVLRLVLTDSASATPVIGALVSVLSATGVAVADGLSNDRGTVTIRVPATGVFAVSVRRIGVRPRTVPEVRIAADGVTNLSLALGSTRHVLRKVLVVAESPVCGRAPQGDGRAANLWEQITLALRATTLAASDSSLALPMRITDQLRELGPSLELMEPAQTASRIGFGRVMRAEDPVMLATEGFVRPMSDGGMLYSAPDESVLLSPAFIASHCFAVPAVEADPAVAELRFTPLPRRKASDVEGTVYVDAQSGELRRIEFRYVASRTLIPVKAQHAGGEVVMRRLGGGQWIVSQWAIRMPLYEIRSGSGYLSLRGYRETSGLVEPLAPSPPP